MPPMKKRPYSGGPAVVKYKPKKKVVPIPAGRTIRNPGDPKPATWRRSPAKKTTSPMRRTRRG